MHKNQVKRNLKKLNNQQETNIGAVVIFIDEFTNYNEAYIGIAAVKLLSKLGYKINFVKHPESGRSKLSKGYFGKRSIDIYAAPCF